MKLLALVEGNDHVCYRYRVAAFADALAERGAMLEAVPLARGTLRRLKQLRRASAADVVLLQRKLLPLGQLYLLRRWSKRLIFDCDDAVYHRDSNAAKGPESWRREFRFWATVYSADLITAGNHTLVDHAAGMTDTHRVHYVPTCVDPHRYPRAAHNRDDGQTRLVWIGSHSTLPSLHDAHACLKAATAQTPGLELRVLCDEFPRLEGVRVVERRWSSETEASEIAAADVGISWLPHHPWSWGKCGLKVLQYMAAGLPVVANPIGVHRTMVVDGTTGFLVSSAEDAAQKISQLAHDPDLRRRMGSAGRERVAAEYSVGRWSGVFADLVTNRERGDSLLRLPQERTPDKAVA